MRKTSGYERQAEDAYQEPAWCVERLFEHLALTPGSIVLDPACGTGTIPLAARRAGLKGIGTDLVKRWPDGVKGLGVRDWFDPEIGKGPTPWAVTAIVSNPPYKKAREFAELALVRSDLVALLLPTSWIQGLARSVWLAETPLCMVMPLCPRPSMPPIGSGVKASGGKVDYSWFVWGAGWVMSPEVKWLYK